MTDSQQNPAEHDQSELDSLRQALNLKNERLKLFDSVISNTNDCVVICKTLGQSGEPEIVYVNRTFESFTGYAPEEVYGLNPRFLQSKKIDNDSLNRLRSAIESKQACRVDLLNIKKSGEEFWVDMNLTPLMDETGNVTHYVSIQRDITSRKRNEVQMKLSDMVLANANDMVLICEAEPIDQPGPRIIFANKTFEKVTGYSQSEVIGLTPRILQGADTDRATLDRIRRALQRWEPVCEEVLNYTKSGESFWSEVSVTPVKNEFGVHTHFIGIHRIVTDRKIAEQNLKAALDEAETARLNAEHADEAKGRFLATVSHELRTPMNGVLGMAHLLAMDGISDAQRKEYAQVIINSGQTLTRLLNDILDFSAIHTNKLELVHAPFEPVEVVNKSINLYRLMAREKSLEIQVSFHGLEGRKYSGDALRLRQIVSNLISNAIKFTEAGSVSLEVKELGVVDDMVSLGFKVSDTGIGIPYDKQATLFEAFSQADETDTRRYGGAGLGLAIVKDLVQLMGGEVSLTSREGAGSEFSFNVLVKPVHTEVKTPKGTALEEGGVPIDAARVCRHILIVDDNVINIKVTAAILSRMGLDVSSLENGEDAVQAIKKGLRPDLVLMDVQMPVLDGLKATELIRQWEAATDRDRLPIVALTGGALEDGQARCLAAGMDGFMTKPLKVDELERVIRLCATVKQAKSSAA